MRVTKIFTIFTLLVLSMFILTGCSTQNDNLEEKNNTVDNDLDNQNTDLSNNNTDDNLDQEIDKNLEEDNIDEEVELGELI